ncbi:metal ABC transporter permease [Labrys neptuniae]|uniref:metal ABC transporter permease n=1 Tax=Labrys neptuniae TaxID=376174 RepID=UPI00288C7622|nr:metal ABC transporter permease [Labrys neptuniae]MDT3382310.1 metal ABC transporter permease [Labrys neptuniae]
MEMVQQALLAPFVEFAFMRRALLGTFLICVSACPVGVFLMLRRMSLAGDAMAHAILPGAAAGFALFGLELVPMTLGGLIAGGVVALGAGAVSRFTILREDAAMAAFYLISLAAGVVMVSARGSGLDLLHILFGTVLALDDQALALIGLIAAVTSTTVLLLWRGLVAECLDPLYLRSVSKLGPALHFAFLVLLVLNLIAGFQALGTLLCVGLMILPAAAARFWADRAASLCLTAIAFGLAASLAGLLLSYHAALPSGPAIILSAGSLYLGSLLLGPRGLRLSLHASPRRRAI